MNMPTYRDVRVGKGPEPEGEPTKKPANPKANLVTVTGFGGKDDVLFSSTGARLIRWHDSEGELAAMLMRLNEKLWGLCLRGDDDWNEMVKLYGDE